jgi:hypothetical protein
VTGPASTGFALTERFNHSLNNYCRSGSTICKPAMAWREDRSAAWRD